MKTTSLTRFTTTKLALCATLLFTTNSISAETDTLNAADVKFVKQEAAASKAVVKIAELGTQKAIRPEVKAFAELLSKDHGKAIEELTNLAKTKGVELSAVIAPEHAETFQDLEKAEDAKFDKAFLSAIESGHEKCVSNFQESSEAAKNNDVRQWALTTLPVLESHLAKARELNSSSSASANRTSTNTDRNMRARNTAEGSKTERTDADHNTAKLTPLNQGNSEADTNTTAEIRKEIIANDNMSVNAQNVKIITNTGKVTLRGAVNTAEEKRLIGEIANRIARSENVDNQLDVPVTTSGN